MQYITTEQVIHLDGPFPRKQLVLEEGAVVLSPSEVDHIAMNVLPVYVEQMTENAKTMRESGAAIEAAGEPERKEGTINITPSPRACQVFADEFEAQAKRAQLLIAALQGAE